MPPRKQPAPADPPKARKKSPKSAPPPPPPEPTDRAGKSPYALHVERWRNGCGAEICEGARKCLARGSLPADVLFLGEAPGESENVLGRPFVGPAGQLLDHIVERIFETKTRPARLCPVCEAEGVRRYQYEMKGRGLTCDDEHDDSPPGRLYRWVFTNLVGCIPREPGGRKAVEPDDDSVIACGPRVIELVKIADPALLVCVGKHAKDWTEPGYKHSLRFHRKIPQVHITHPAAILRANAATQSLLVQRAVVAVATAVKDLADVRGEEEVD